MTKDNMDRLSWLRKTLEDADLDVMREMLKVFAVSFLVGRPVTLREISRLVGRPDPRVAVQWRAATPRCGHSRARFSSARSDGVGRRRS